MSNRVVAVFAAVATLGVLTAAPAAQAQSQAQAWPQRTVRFIVPLPPGSGMDLSARVVAERLAQKWGQPVVVENRQGADGIPAVTSFLVGARQPHLPVLVRRHRHLQPPAAREAALRSARAGADRACHRQLPRRVGHRHAEGEYGRRAGAGREGAARQAQLGRDAGPAGLCAAGAAAADRHRDGERPLSRLRAGLSGPQPGPPACHRHRRADAGGAPSRRHRQAPVRHQPRALAAGAGRADRQGSGLPRPHL